MKMIEEHLSQTPPPALVHYTTANGMQGILTSRSLWASHIRFLNDAQEFVHAVGLAKDCLGRLREIGGSQVGELCDCLLNRLVDMPGNTWIVSFSEAADTLSQWRAYGGYSIEFDAQKLAERANKQAFVFVRCEYNRDNQKALLKELIDTAIDAFSSHAAPEAYSEEERRNHFASTWFFPKMLSLGSAMKHPAFSEEREWRLIGGLFKPHVTPAVRAQGSLLIPYQKFELGTVDEIRRDVKQIQIGPNSNQELADFGVFSLLRAADTEGIRIYRSETPYRPK